MSLSHEWNCVVERGLPVDEVQTKLTISQFLFYIYSHLGRIINYLHQDRDQEE